MALQGRQLGWRRGKAKESSETADCNHLSKRSLPPKKWGSGNREKGVDMNKIVKEGEVGPNH